MHRIENLLVGPYPCLVNDVRHVIGPDPPLDLVQDLEPNDFVDVGHDALDFSLPQIAFFTL